MRGLSTSVIFNLLPALGMGLQSKVGGVVRQTTLDLEEEAQRNAHVITGSMRGSVYHAIAGGESNYSEHASDAEDLNKRVVILDQIFPELGTPDGLSAIVGVAAMHGIFEEIGRGHRFLLPAAETVHPIFQERCAEVLR